MGNLEKKLAEQGDDESRRQRKLAEAIAESRINTQEFVAKMRGQKFGSIALYARVSLAPPTPIAPAKRFRWPKPTVATDTRPVHEYSVLGRGWAVDLSNSDAVSKYAFIIDNLEQPTVYKDANLPSTSNNLYVRPDSNTLEKPCLIVYDAPHHPVQEHAVVHDMFTGDYGHALLANAVKVKGLPRF